MSPSINEIIDSLGRDLQPGDLIISNRDSHEGISPTYPAFEVTNPHISKHIFLGIRKDFVETIRHTTSGQQLTVYIRRDKDLVSRIIPHKER